jgi:N-acetylmuramic acid 6-phosphate etherase
MQDNQQKAAFLADADRAFARALLASQKAAIDAVESALHALSDAADAMAAALRAGRRVIYAGAGSSGLIALQDGAELAGTFGLDPDRIGFILAGGLHKRTHIDAAAEDDRAAAARDMAAESCREGDAVIAVSASGSTPYTLACAESAKRAGAKVIGLANRPEAPLLALADVAVMLDSGPEALYGSTRLAAGTAQKAALGLISTLANARLGHVWRGHMVNVRPRNDKLRLRAAHIVAALTDVGEDEAARFLAQADDDVKCAILLASGAASAGAARDGLAAAQGRLDIALARLRA